MCSSEELIKADFSHSSEPVGSISGWLSASHTVQRAGCLSSCGGKGISARAQASLLGEQTRHIAAQLDMGGKWEHVAQNSISEQLLPMLRT